VAEKPARSRSRARAQANGSLAIASDDRSDGADVWLTWRTAVGRDGTWIELQLDELERGPDPTGALDTLLDTLAERLRRPPAIAEP
jgi:hypothetical protein